MNKTNNIPLLKTNQDFEIFAKNNKLSYLKGELIRANKINIQLDKAKEYKGIKNKQLIEVLIKYLKFDGNLNVVYVDNENYMDLINFEVNRCFFKFNNRNIYRLFKQPVNRKFQFIAVINLYKKTIELLDEINKNAND